MAEGIYDITPSAADIMTAKDSHGEVQGDYRPMRGQAYVLMLDPEPSPITLTGHNPREEKWHRGRILALGEPAFLDSRQDSPVVPWDVSEGDEVIFLLAVWLDKMRIMAWRGQDRNVAVVAQVEIIACLPSS